MENKGTPKKHKKKGANSGEVSRSLDITRESVDPFIVRQAEETTSAYGKSILVFLRLLLLLLLLLILLDLSLPLSNISEIQYMAVSFLGWTPNLLWFLLVSFKTHQTTGAPYLPAHIQPAPLFSRER